MLRRRKPKRTFLGFQYISCETCGHYSLYPLTKTYVVFYWTFIGLVSLSVVMTLTQSLGGGLFILPGWFSIFAFFAGAYGLSRDRKIYRDVLNNPPKFDWGKELFLGLLFVCVGFTVWPLICYYGGIALGIPYFVDLSLRVWAEGRVYGPLADGGFRSLSHLLFLLGPYLFVLGLRIVLAKARTGNTEENEA
jgi:hypothetical protein